MPFFPYGTLPGESNETHVHISGRTWFLLRRSDPHFLKNWKSAHLSRPHHLTVSCITRGVPEDQMVTLVRMWHQKHGHGFYEDDFWKRIFPPASKYALPIVLTFQAKQYWNEIRRIQSDPKARQHSKLRVAYFLMNTGTAAAKEIHKSTGIPLKTVRNCLGTLQQNGKVEVASYGVYRANRGFYWDRVNVGEGPQGRYTWDDDHPAMYSFVTPNWVQCGEDGVSRMTCYDFCRDSFSTVLFDSDQRFLNYFPNPGDCEWVVNAEGDVVENGTGLRFLSLLDQFEKWEVVWHTGNRLDFRKANLKVTARKSVPGVHDEPQEDFFARLCSGKAA
jgi:hypothetical protein